MQVAGIPVKFKYVQVKPYDYGLNALDILMADDKELNKIVSIKKLQPYVVFFCKMLPLP